MLGEVKGLYSLGFGVHGLRTRSKVPKESGWTKGPRKAWAVLEKTVSEFDNVGVRLGTASKLSDGTYLAVVDCDVKSREASHRAEMQEALKGLGFGLNGPVVLSGRGNGSKHHYVRVKSVFRTYRYSQSKHSVKVSMPSVKASPKDKERLTPVEIGQGYRMRPAWEISVMCEGSQVVLPPSIHPDSGKPYKWNGAEPKEARAFPLAAFRGPEKTDLGAVSLEGFTPVEVDLTKTKLSAKTIALVTDGDECEDRSAGLMSAALSMVRIGMPEIEILSVLTDEGTFLGQAAYDHAKTRSRKVAAEWVKRYTLTKAQNLLSAEKDFESELQTSELEAGEAALQAAELTAEAWELKIERTGKDGMGPPRSTLQNLIWILKNAVAENVFVRDEFAHTDLYGVDTPWGGVSGREIRDIDTLLLKTWFAKCWRLEPANDKLEEAIARIAYDNRYHPVRDFLDGIAWDGKARVDTWLKDYMGAVAPEPYLSEISRKTICAMVARILEPGVKYDQVLVLEGPQGCGKSSAVRILAGNEWFTDTYLDVRNKDSALALRSKWVLEIGELAAANKADVETLKAFISTQTDYLRAPYGRRHETHPRQCIFIGTTNSTEYLKDDTGGRRFWPVRVERCLREELARDRDQLLAEARMLYMLGETLYLEPGKGFAQAVTIQEERTHHDSLADALEAEILPKLDEVFKMTDLFAMLDDFGTQPGEKGLSPFLRALKPTMPDIHRVSRSLRKLGYEAKIKRLHRNNRKQDRVWMKKEL